ncbi:hypothetical protein JQN58_09120 [Aneurinibacillus sp. BA2021]|nr:hypothetical protein [Aneurinibacillus sp. BA2021]
MKIDEINFVQQIKQGNTKALEFIVDTYSNLVFKVVGSVLNTSFHSQYIEECSNDIFWSVWNNIESFDEEKKDDQGNLTESRDIVRRDEQHPNEFTMAFHALDAHRNYHIGTNDFANFEIREDLKFTIDLQ